MNANPEFENSAVQPTANPAPRDESEPTAEDLMGPPKIDFVSVGLSTL